MVDGRVVKRPRASHRFLKLNFRVFGSSWLNWRQGEALRWKVEIASWEGCGVACGKPAPHEQVLNLPPPPCVAPCVD
jgi:hypothetical protein